MIKQKLKNQLKNIFESICYISNRHYVSNCKPRHIVFICKGNICRSIFAENYLRSIISDVTITIESYGLDVDKPGSSPNEAIVVGKEFKVTLDSHQSKSITQCNIECVDLIVLMEYKHYLRLVNMYPSCKHKIRLIQDFTPWPYNLLCNIYDPYGLTEVEYRFCFKRIKKALDYLNASLII